MSPTQRFGFVLSHKFPSPLLDHMHLNNVDGYPWEWRSHVTMSPQLKTNKGEDLKKLVFISRVFLWLGRPTCKPLHPNNEQAATCTSGHPITLQRDTQNRSAVLLKSVFSCLTVSLIPE